MMREVGAIAALMLLGLIAQMSLLSEFPFSGEPANLLLVITLCLAVVRGPWPALVAGLAAGFCLDQLLGSGIIQMLSFVAPIYLITVLSARFMVQNWSVAALLVGMGTAVSTLATAVLLTLTGHPFVWEHLAGNLLPQMLVNGLLAPWIYLVLERQLHRPTVYS